MCIKHFSTIIVLLLLHILQTNCLESDDIEIVESLVRNWAPLVWLAPDEKFMPGSVTDFLNNVHAERAKITATNIQDIGDINNLDKYSQLYNSYYATSKSDKDKDLMYYDPITNGNFRYRSKRNFKDKSTNLDYIFELPIEENSLNWFLVTNEKIEDLVKNESSFIYGKNPTHDPVPVYAVVTACDDARDKDLQNDINLNLVDNPKFQYKKNPYIPLDVAAPSDALQSAESTISTRAREERLMRRRGKRQTIIAAQKPPHIVYAESVKDNLTYDSNMVGPSITMNDWKVMSVTQYVMPESDNVPNQTSYELSASSGEVPHGSGENIQTTTNSNPSKPKPQQKATFPVFHVTYWMFYPYSMGKVMCTINLGPLGPLPIPLIWGMCLGNKKEFGSHVGDWEHMSLSFNGRNEPEEMYISVHDAGAFYSYDRLTGTFEYKSQETRKGILQHPNFPRTVLTSSNHPVVFAAEGSHGLWTAPGNHRFVRIPRLYDINGFGTPWSTWKNVQILHNKDQHVSAKRSPNPNWFKYRGRWGNPKSQCHPLRKIGLHFCQFSDGPTGIPRKEAHFDCTV